MSDAAPPAIIGTAGHVDHGKTTLVHRLTGVQLDRLPEEQERGITIQLGFTAAELDGQRVAFIDVPGHERLVRTMVAGAAGIDAVLLCVSALDGVMPQTIEHVGICDALGVKQGVVALTQCDRVDAELLELARADVEDLVAGTFLANAPIVAVSSVSGEGIEALTAELAALRPTVRKSDGLFRLPIDRSFQRPGFGTVVSGTVWSGSVRDGARVFLLPGPTEARVRGLQVHGVDRPQAVAGERLALNLAGIEHADASRGTTLCSRELATTQVLDVRLRSFNRAITLEDGAPVRLLLGTAQVMGQVHFASSRDTLLPGAEIFAQLRLDAPVLALPGDRFVLRRPSPETTLAGGEVLDPWAPRMRNAQRKQVQAELTRLAGGDRTVLLERAGDDGLSAEEARLRGVEERAVILADRRFAPAVLGRLEGRVLDLLTQFHTDNPLSLGANRRALHRDRVAHLPERVFDAVLDRLVSTGLATAAGPLVRLKGFAVQLDAEQKALQQAVFATVVARGLEGLRPEDLSAHHDDPQAAALAQLLLAERELVLVRGLGWVAGSALDALCKDVRAYFASHDSLDAQAFKKLTGLSRRAAIPLLEWLDTARVTRRAGDTRTLHPGG